MPDHFPALVSILSPQALADDTLPRFGIGPVARCELYSAGFNHTYRVKTVRGVIYYLRAYRPQWRTLADIQYELDVLNHLKQKGFPAAQPVAFEDGRFFCAVAAPEGIRYLALFTEAPGKEISYEQNPESMAVRYGQAVAQMHTALTGFSSPHPRFHLDMDHYIDRSLRHIAPFLSDRPDDWRYIQTFAEKLRQRILALPADDLEQGFCHGDLQGYHASVNAEGTLTFYDFDCGGMGWRAYDLAVFLWCCRLQDAVSARWDSFLTGYRQIRPIRDLDMKAVPLLVCARYLWHIGVHTENAPDWGVGFLDEAYFNDHLKRLHQAEDDYLSE